MDAKKPSPGTFKCALCGDVFNTNKHLIKHKSVHANENRTFTCTKCKSTFTDHCEYLLHEVTHLHHKIEQKCVECGVFKKKIGLPIHIMTHFDQRKQSCEFCNIVLPIEELKKHIRTHTITNNMCECEICGKTLVAWKYEAHVMKHAVDMQETFPCLYCDKVFQTKKYLKYHTKLHTGERSEVCNACGLLFTSRDSLERHQEKHKLEKKYQCDYCYKEFVNRSRMVSHILLHTRGSFRCMVNNCKFTASMKEDIVEHQKIAHYYCKICKIGFDAGDKFRRHLTSSIHRKN